MKTKMALIISFFLGAMVFAQHKPTTSSSLEKYEGTSFSEVWDRINSELYETLPAYKIVSADTLKSLATFAMNATLDNRNDFRERRVKLVHPNGICLSGTWQIDTASEFTGYFAKNSTGLVVARASVTQDYVNRDEYRAFGLAVKIFPTLDPNQAVYTSNVFSVDNIEGVKDIGFTKTRMANQIPDFDFLNVAALFRLRDRLPFLINFNNLSKENDTGPENRNPLIRRTVEVARAGVTREFSPVGLKLNLPSYKDLGEDIKEPTWIAFEAEADTFKSNESDFRNEITDIVATDGALKFKILISNEADEFGNQYWSRIGTLTFDKAVASLPCDQDLHFHHPRTDDGL